MGSDHALVIGISGPSSSGKTTLARLLQSVFSGLNESLRTFIIHEDDFYFPDDRIPYTTTPSGKTVQDWDTVEAIDVDFLSSALSYVRENGRLPPRLASKEDLNEASDSGVPDSVVEELRATILPRVVDRLADAASPDERDRHACCKTLAFLEGFLLYSPPLASSGGDDDDHHHVLRPVHENIHLHLFLPAPYDKVKARREGRSGYVTIGAAPVPTENNATTTTTTTTAGADEEVDLEGEDDRPPQNFWTDPPGYVDDIVWPRYVRDHAWLLLPEGEPEAEGRSTTKRTSAETTEELIKKVGQGTNVRTDAGVVVAPGKGIMPMSDILHWAVEEILRYWEAKQKKEIS